MHDAPEGSFNATLSGRQRRLASRLEGFGDIVFGFAVSQCALQLPIDHGHVDLSNPLALALYFATYAIIASLWIAFHRLMSGTFVPTGVDLIGAFAYLAFVSLIPFAMYGITHTLTSLDAARIALAEYQLLYIATMVIAAFLTFRNLRRGWLHLEPAERDEVWLAFVRRLVVGALMLVALAINLVFGPTLSGISLMLIFVVTRLVRRFIPHAPASLAPRRFTERAVTIGE